MEELEGDLGGIFSIMFAREELAAQPEDWWGVASGKLAERCFIASVEIPIKQLGVGRELCGFLRTRVADIWHREGSGDDSYASLGRSGGCLRRRFSPGIRRHVITPA